jgi:aminopeptidase N
VGRETRTGGHADRLLRACTIALTGALSLGSPSTLDAQDAPRSQQIGTTYQPGIDVLDYDVLLVLPDTGAFIRGDVTVTFLRAPSASRLRLDLVGSLRVRSVELNGKRIEAVRGGDHLDVPLSSAVGDSAQVRVVYDGVATDGLVVRKDAKGRWTWFGDNWPDRTRQWLPTVDHPSDKATVSWRIRASERNVVVSNGASLGTNHLTVDGRRVVETRWRESRPIPPYLMVIGVGPMVRYDLRETVCHRDDDGECAAQSIYVMPENRGWLPGAFASAGPIMSLFERLVAPFPYEKLAHVQSSTRYGGMENASAIFYDGKLFPTQKVTESLLAHEIAHQWFGDAVTEREWAHLWLSEGISTYFAALWEREARGERGYRDALSASRAKVLDDSEVARRPVIDTAQTDFMQLLNTNSYDKGSFVLSMLHQEVGDSAFFRGIRSYYATHRHGTALSDDLRTALERSSDRSLAAFFDQWLRRPGYAEPAIGWAYDARSGTVSLLVLQEGRFGAYALSVPVVVTDAGGVRHRLMARVPAEARATIPLADHFSQRPVSLAVDPDSTLLARITRL